MDRSRPVQELIRCPFGHKAVCSGQVIFIGSVTVRAFNAPMDGNTFVMVINLDSTTGKQQLDFLADKAVGNTIIMLIHTQANMPVLHHRSQMLTLKLIPKDR